MIFHFLNSNLHKNLEKNILTKQKKITMKNSNKGLNMKRMNQSIINKKMNE